MSLSPMGESREGYALFDGGYGGVSRHRVGYLVNLLTNDEMEIVSRALEVLLAAFDRETTALVDRAASQRS